MLLLILCYYVLCCGVMQLVKSSYVFTYTFLFVGMIFDSFVFLPAGLPEEI